MLDVQFVGAVGKAKQMHILSYTEPMVHCPSTVWFHK